MAGSGFILSYQPSSGATGGGNVDMYEAAGNPGVNNDGVDTAGLGQAFHEGDLWFNSATGILWVCMDDTTGAAVWRINAVSTTGAPSDNEVPRYDGTTGQLIQGSGVTLTDGGVLTLGATGGVNVNTGTAILDATSLRLASALGLGATPTEAKGLVLRSTTAAALGVQQVSPALYQAGQGWETGVGSSDEVIFRRHVVPVEGATVSGYLSYAASLNGGAYAELVRLDSSANWLWAADGVGSLGAAAANRPASVFATTSININNGSAVLSTTALTIASAMALGVTPVETHGLVLRSTTAAALGAQQISPALYQAGQGWETGVGSSDEVIFRRHVVPVEGGTVSGYVSHAVSLNGGAYSELLRLDSGANLLWATDGVGSIGAAAATRPANVYATASINLANGSAVLSTTALTVSSAMAIGATPVESKGLVLRNTTAAANGAQQWTPSIFLAGQGWETGTGSSDEVVWRFVGVPLQGPTVSTNLLFSYSLNGGPWFNAFYCDAAGNLCATGGFYGGTLLNLAGSSNVLSATALTTSSAMAIGSTPTETKGLVLRNTTAAGAGAQQYSPSIFLAGQGWETTGGSSDEVVFRLTNAPAQGLNVSGAFRIDVSLNGGAYANCCTVDSAGLLTAGAISSGTYLWANTYLAADGYAYIRSTNTITTGIDTTVCCLYTGRAEPVALYNNRADAANVVVIGSLYGVAAASITNAATIRQHSFGWINNVGVYAELAAVMADGVLYSAAQKALVAENASSVIGRHLGTGTAGTGAACAAITAGMVTKVQVETLNPNAIETAMTTAVPASSVIRAVIANCEAALTGGGTTVTWSVGTAADPDKYGTAGYPVAGDSLAKNSKSNWMGATQVTSDETIVLTGAATGGAADGDTALTVGSVKIMVIYDTYDAMPNAA